MPRTTDHNRRRELTGLELPAGVSDQAAAVLRDRGRLDAMYQTHTIHQMMDELGIRHGTLRRVMRVHGIAVRDHGQRVAHQKVHRPEPLTRQLIRLAAWRAYRRLEQCPPDCPFYMGCAEDEDGCRLQEMLS